MTTRSIEGGCWCGAIRYRATGEPIAQSNCHCATCRKSVGAAAVAWVTVRSSQFAVLTGEPTRFRSSAAVTRTFCNQCGTSLTYQHDTSQDEIDITTATLDNPSAFAPDREVWIDQQLSWTSLDPALAHYPRGSAG